MLGHQRCHVALWVSVRDQGDSEAARNCKRLIRPTVNWASLYPLNQELPMANHDISFLPDPDAESISSDVAGFGGLLVSTQIPTRADGSLELGGITEQSECTLQALKVALEKAGSSMDRVLHLTIYLTDITERAAFNEVYKRFFAKPWPVRAAVGVAALGVPGMRVEVTAMAAKG
jgi:enamine deaminase RidA (YjgF/YER057c/UK114 family)